MHFIDASAVHDLLDYAGLVGALRAAHCRAKPLVDRAGIHRQGDGEGRQSFLNLPAWIPGVAMGIKSVTVMPANEQAHGLPTVHAVYLVFDGVTGAPTATMDGTALTLRKTAADSALGADILARRDVATMLMAGAGAMAPHLVAAHRAVRPAIERVLIWNRTGEKADRLAAQLRDEGVDASRVDDLEPAVRQADLVSCATSATAPIIAGDWLKPGAHLDLVGAFTPDMRECDDDAVRRCEIFVDSRWFAIHEPGDLAQPIADGVIAETDVRADLFELCGGEHGGRGDARGVTLFKNGGGAHLDLYTAQYLLQRQGQRR